jgi:fatty-acyl-CoA synthase
MPYFLRGATNVIVRGGFDISRFLKTIEQEKVTAFTCVPTMLIRLLDHPELHKHDLSSLRNIGCGAAPLAVERIKEAIRTFGPILTQNYGLTEAYMTVCTLPKEEHKVTGAPEEVKRLGATGRPYTFVEVRVVDDSFNDVAPGERGEIVVRSDHVMKGYWRLPEETAAAFHDGWLLSGDIATVDERGYVYIVDRKKDLIISGGFNIYPREVEEALYQHPAVQEAAVIGVPDPEWGESVKAFVTLREGAEASEEELIDFCRTKIGFKKPRYVEILGELPKSSTGKIDKKALERDE